MANYFNGFRCGHAHIRRTWGSACGAEHACKGGYFCSTKEVVPSPLDTTVVFAACISLPWAVWGWTKGCSSLPRSGSSFWACWRCNIVFTARIAHSPMARPNRQSRSWSSISVVTLTAIRMTGFVCHHRQNLLTTAVSALPSSRPLFLCSMVSRPMTTELRWGGCSGVFPWGRPSAAAAWTFFFPQEQLEKA